MAKFTQQILQEKYKDLKRTRLAKILRMIKDAAIEVAKETGSEYLVQKMKQIQQTAGLGSPKK